MECAYEQPLSPAASSLMQLSSFDHRSLTRQVRSTIRGCPVRAGTGSREGDRRRESAVRHAGYLLDAGFWSRELRKVAAPFAGCRLPLRFGGRSLHPEIVRSFTSEESRGPNSARLPKTLKEIVRGGGSSMRLETNRTPNARHQFTNWPVDSMVSEHHNRRSERGQ